MKKTIAALWLFATVPALAQNPISPMGVYIADPSSRVVDGRLYVYGSLDVSPGRYCSKDYHVLSSPDLRNWTLHPYSFRNDIDLYAPDMKTLDMSTQVDGIVTEKDHFFHEGSYVVKRGGYYYFIFADISRNGRPTCLGYAMATSPLGPYEYKGVIIDNAGCDPETWNNTITDVDKAALFTEAIGVSQFKEVSCTAVDKDYDIVLGTRYNGEYRLIHVTHSHVFTFKGTDVTITGEWK